MPGRYSRGSLWAPKQDTGWGLIFRLNDILSKIERDTESGDLNKWDLHLNRIYANIIYKNPMEVVKDKNGNDSIIFSKEDIDEVSIINSQIESKKKEISLIAKFSDSLEDQQKLSSLKNEFYNLLFKKDILMRKKMFRLNLYLQQVEHDPSRAIYGG